MSLRHLPLLLLLFNAERQLQLVIVGCDWIAMHRPVALIAPRGEVCWFLMSEAFVVEMMDDIDPSPPAPFAAPAN